MSVSIKLNKLERELAKLNLEAEKQPRQTSDVADIKVMAEILSKQTRLTRKIADVKEVISRESLWQAKLTLASEIEPVPISWMWPQWIAFGKLTILAGAGGTGKTTLALSLAATLTNGGLWPDRSICSEKGNVIIWSSEDEPSDTLVPRLIAAGANLDKVRFIEGRIGPKGQLEPFDPAVDLDTLRSAALLFGGVSLLIFDPIVNLIKGDMYKPNDVRRGLQGVVDFAQKMECAVLGISHFSKGSAGTSAADRVIGSQAFSALARTVLVAGKQDDSEIRVLARAKSNIASDQGGCSYSIELINIETKKGQVIETTNTVWGDYIEGSASEILSTIEMSSGSSGEDDPVEALKAVLHGGRMLSQEANQIMAANGYSLKQTRTAREKLNVNIVREGYSKDLKSYWELPSTNTIASNTTSFSTNAHSCPPCEVGMN